METAVLRLGLAGFRAGEKAAIEKIAAAFRRTDWLCGDADGADAWLIDGAHVTDAQGEHVRVMCTDAAGRMQPIVIDGASRPLAFARAPGVRVPTGTHPVFDFSQPATLTRVLQQFDRELHAAKTRFWTAAHILEHHATVGKAIYELRAGAEVLAVVDMKGDVAVSPTAAESSFDEAVWVHRARKAVTVPAWFQHTTLSHLVWQYMTGTRRELLPPRYRDCPIFFRRPPRVDPQLIGDIHLLVSRQLALGPATLADLSSALHLDDEAVSKALAALYFVGSVTSNPDRAWKGSVRGGLWSQPAPLAGDAMMPSAPRMQRDAPPSTAPLM
jgi:hypothetical protein